MKFVTIFVAIILFIPIACVMLYTIFYPRDSALLGKRWQFKNENLEPSDEIIKYNRIAGIIGLVVSILMLIFVIIKY
ncbi:hypothetical protein CCS79_09230 [Clostridium diolis]|uniref:hypothetical protein n=1 Tax=Clostridium diolis TaxID=223919 RepID=UPI000B40154E|nr:hypothetical protein [Clostridium diolis]OVE69096.1 hypothetical protein CCS79_09230 [Clostridium diolis]